MKLQNYTILFCTISLIFNLSLFLVNNCSAFMNFAQSCCIFQHTTINLVRLPIVLSVHIWSLSLSMLELNGVPD